MRGLSVRVLAPVPAVPANDVDHAGGGACHCVTHADAHCSRSGEPQGGVLHKPARGRVGDAAILLGVADWFAEGRRPEELPGNCDPHL